MNRLTIFLLGQFISLIAERITTLSFLSLIALVSINDVERNTSLVGFFQILPIFIFSFIGGAFSDKFQRKWYLISLSGLRVLVFVVFLFYYSKDKSIELVFVTVTLLGIFTAFYNPAKKSFIPFLTKKASPSEIKFGNGLLTTSEIMATVIGIGIGILLLQFLNPIQLIIVDMCAFSIAGLVFFFLPNNIDSNENVSSSLFVELTKSFKYVWKNSKVKTLMFFLIIPFYCAAAFFYIAVSYWSVYSSSNSGATVGFFFLIFASGAVVSFFLRKIIDNLKISKHPTMHEFRMLVWISLAASICIFILSFLGNDVGIIFWLFVFLSGLFVGLLYTRTIYLFQMFVDSEVLGRIMSLNEIIFGLSFTLVIPIFTVFFKGFTPQLGWVLSSLLLFVSFLGNLFFLKSQEVSKFN